MRTKITIAVAAAIASSQALAADTFFDNFTPMANSVSPAVAVGLEATQGMTLATPTPGNLFKFRSVADRSTQLGLGEPNSGSWDMITTNETGPNAGRYLFTVFETGASGVQRTDIQNNYATETIWQTPGTNFGHVAFDASYWTPWGTYITAEESWSDIPNNNGNPYGRLFELTNPLTATDTASAQFFHRNVVPRTSHEGIQFDASGKMYFIDELNGGSIYRYTTAANFNDVLAGTADYFAAGTTAVLRVGTGNTPNATGAFSWVDFTDANGLGLAGSVTITDPNGVTSVDARATTNVAAFKGTDYQRPEDLQIKTLANGDEVIFVATTTTNEVYTINLTDSEISIFANVNTLNLATNAAVGAGLRSPDNLAIDADGNIYIIEDRNGGSDDDIWFANDLNDDGDLLDAGEGLARWASNGIAGSEFTGLYFDPFNANRAWVNIQHPTSGNDRMFEITAVPVPAALPLMFSALGGLGFAARRRK